MLPPRGGKNLSVWGRGGCRGRLQTFTCHSAPTGRRSGSPREERGMRVKYKFLALPATLCAVAALAACGSSNSSSTSGGAGGGSKEPLRVALIPPSTGALAVFGTDATKGWQVAANEANASGGIDGHKVVLVKVQTDGQPPTTIRAARKAATQQNAHYFGAVMTSPEHAALAQQLPSMNALDLNALGKDDALTGAGYSPYAVRSVQSNAMDVNAIAATMKNLPAKRWAIQAV